VLARHLPTTSGAPKVTTLALQLEMPPAKKGCVGGCKRKRASERAREQESARDRQPMTDRRKNCQRRRQRQRRRGGGREGGQEGEETRAEVVDAAADGRKPAPQRMPCIHDLRHRVTEGSFARLDCRKDLIRVARPRLARLAEQAVHAVVDVEFRPVGAHADEVAGREVRCLHHLLPSPSLLPLTEDLR
jgi:hypothetical protein